MKKNLGELASKERDLARILNFSQELNKRLNKLFSDEEWFRHYHFSSNVKASNSIKKSSKHLIEFQKEILLELKDLDVEISELYFDLHGKKINKLTND